MQRPDDAKPQRRFPLRLFDVVWVSLLIAYILIGVPLVPFHGDESTLIYTTQDYAQQFIERDLSKVTYSADLMEQRLRLLDGRVHKYLAGLFWHAVGYTVDDLNTPWEWGADRNYNQNAGHIPTRDLLIITRFASALLMAAGVVAMFGIGVQVDGRAAAYAASLFYALNPALLLNGRRSMMEGGLMLFTLLTVLAALLLIRRRSWGAAALLGLSAGMAISSKHTGVLTVVLVFAACGIDALLRVMRTHASVSRQRLIADVARLSLAGVIALVVFYMLNPAWWDNPLGTALEVAQLRTTLLGDQSSTYGEYADWGSKTAGFGEQVLIGMPQFYEDDDFAEYIADEIALYNASPWRGMSLGQSLFGLALLTVLIAAGLWRLVRRRQIPPAQRWLIGLWAVGICMALLVLTPLEWQRYYLPALLAISVLVGLGAAQIVSIITRRFAQNPIISYTSLY